VAALESIPNAFTAPSSGGGARCDQSSTLTYVALEDLSGVTCHNGPDAPAPCDVCGGRLFPGVVGDVVLAPVLPNVTGMAIGISNGSSRIIAVPPATRQTTGRYMLFSLPALPDGLSYVQGPALGYGYVR
jgi:hypothetical protein